MYLFHFVLPSLSPVYVIDYAYGPSPGTENSECNYIFRSSRTENSVFQTLISVPRDGK